METQTLTDVVNTANQMSMWDLVWASDMVTKVVMIGLIAASVWSWAIIIEKFGTLRQVKQLSKNLKKLSGPAVRSTVCTIPSATVRATRCRRCLWRR